MSRTWLLYVVLDFSREFTTHDINQSVNPRCVRQPLADPTYSPAELQVIEHTATGIFHRDGIRYLLLRSYCINFGVYPLRERISQRHSRHLNLYWGSSGQYSSLRGHVHIGLDEIPPDNWWCCDRGRSTVAILDVSLIGVSQRLIDLYLLLSIA